MGTRAYLMLLGLVVLVCGGAWYLFHDHAR
jgi:hypothetical protein